MPRPPRPAYRADFNTAPLMKNLAKANAAKEARRRAVVEQVRAMWVMGITSSDKIAATLHISPRAVRDYLNEIRTELVAQNLDSLSARIAHTVAVHREVERNAWNIVYDPQLAANSQNRVTALGAIMQAEAAINKIQGTVAPDSANSQAIAEASAAMLETLDDIADALGVAPEEVQRVYAKRLQARVGGTSMGLTLGQAESLADTEAREAVEARLLPGGGGDDLGEDEENDEGEVGDPETLEWDGADDADGLDDRDDPAMGEE